MKRKIEEKLLNWKNKTKRKPLLIIGVRQVGKTYTTKKFVKEQFENSFYFNLESDKFIRELFDKTIDPIEMIKNIEIEKELDIPENSSIIFDEIQVNPKAITSLKYFNEVRSDLAVIGTGSLLGVTLTSNNDLSFPVGKVEMLNMYPFSFEEFLEATNNSTLKNEIKNMVKKSFNKEVVKNDFHDKANSLYREYLYIGGMPESISDYLDNKKQAHKIDNNILKNLYNGYISDMTKYISNGIKMTKVLELYKSLPANLNKPNKKFKYTEIEGSRNRRASAYEGALSWLISSNLMIALKRVDQIKKPLKSYETNDFKAFFSDVGLLRSVSNISYKNLLEEDLDDIKGGLAENYVSLELNSLGYEKYYYKTTGKTNIEIDCLISTENSGIIPIEVKWSTNVRSISLNKYKEKMKPKFSIRVSMKNFGFENDILSIPLYAVYALKDII